MTQKNRLAQEQSLYLKQHEANPVDWYPWGDEAFVRARSENKPILLSVGYSACHWCHVMAHESFENDSVAQVMNAHFVCIKVDREERPDIDHIYQSAAQLMGVQGGWPLTVFLTPEGKPFYVGTYFPPEDRYGRPGFKRLLHFIADSYKNQHTKVADTSDQLTQALGLLMRAPQSKESEAFDWTRVTEKLWEDFDSDLGGFGQAPKFPHSPTYELLYRVHNHEQAKSPKVPSQVTSSKKSLDLLHFGLRKMAQGGIYDHVGGGFHRYSTDNEWLVPHFEKMLYDNALLPRAYLDALSAGGDAEFESVVRGVLDYVLSEMTDVSGFFYAAQDADAEGDEGGFFTWLKAELEEIGKSHGIEKILNKLGVTDSGNFEGKNILHLPHGWLTTEEQSLWEKMKPLLYARRETRVKPGRDEKCIVSWNGMMIRTFAQAALTLCEPKYLMAAQKAMAVVAAWSKKGRLPSVVYQEETKVEGFLDDYAFMIDASLWLYQATGQIDYWEQALQWTQVAVQLFWSESDGLFAMAAPGRSGLIVQPVQTYDGATPTGNATMAVNLILMHQLTGNESFKNCTDKMMSAMLPALVKTPAAYTTWLRAKWIVDQGVECCQFILSESTVPTLGLASKVFLEKSLVSRFLVWASNEQDLATFSKTHLDQFLHYRKRQQEGIVECSPSGCTPLRPFQ